MPEQVTLYVTKLCPFCTRVQIALKETNVDYTPVEIDKQNKPEWFMTKINATGLIPAMTYGGPPAPPDDPSPESQKLTESPILVEFIADISGTQTFRPKDPILAARARFFIHIITTKYIPAFASILRGGDDTSSIFFVLEDIQALLPKESTFAVGDDFTMADASFGPLFGILVVALKNDMGAYDAGLGPELYKKLMEGPKFERLRAYWQAIQNRESFKQLFDHDIRSYDRSPFDQIRAKRAATAAAAKA